MEEKTQFQKYTEYMFAFFVIVFYYIYAGWVLSFLWLWFIVPLGVIKIGVVHATGIFIIFQLNRGMVFIPHLVNSILQGKKMVYEPILFLSFGWILNNYFM